jgi:hypothetical protein
MGNASYTKLRSGAWGVRGSGEAPAVGDAVTVTKKSGASDVRTVERVVWSGPARDGNGQAWIASVEADRAPRAYRGSRRSSRSAYRGICEDAPCCGCCGPQSDNQDHWYAGRYEG